MSNNKITTYLLYAIGEIVLVVLGILIAVQIGDLNDRKKTEAKIISLFEEIKEDLSTDIVRANEVLNYYIEKDSIITLALNNQLTSEDYKQNLRRYSLLTTSARHIKIHDDGYKKLMELSDNIHPKFQPIINLLNEMYGSQKYLVDMSDERMNLLTDQNYDFFAQTKSWYHKLRSGQIDDEIIDYFLNDPFYKNKLDSYHTYSIKNYSERIYRFATNAHAAYKLIHDELEPEAPYPNFIARNKIAPSPELIKQFSGVYEVRENSIGNDFSGTVVKVEEFQDHFTIRFGNFTAQEIFLSTRNKLYSGYGMTVSLDPDSSPDSTILHFNSVMLDAKLLKIN